VKEMMQRGRWKLGMCVIGKIHLKIISASQVSVAFCFAPVTSSGVAGYSLTCAIN
jgi:hypothetical protein